MDDVDPESQEEDEEEEDFADYYNNNDIFDSDVVDSSDCKNDPEYFEFECLQVADVDVSGQLLSICSHE